MNILLLKGYSYYQDHISSAAAAAGADNEDDDEDGDEDGDDYGDGVNALDYKSKQDKQPSCKSQDTVSLILMVNIMVAVVAMKRRKQAGHDEKMLKMTNRQTTPMIDD